MGEERLVGVDAEHFWFDGVLVDINQLQFEELRMSRDKIHYTDWQVHEIGVAISTIKNYARRLAKGEQIEPWEVALPIKRLNSQGLHTGWAPPLKA